MQQASVFDGLSFDPFPFDEDCLAAPEVDVGRREVVPVRDPQGHAFDISRLEKGALSRSRQPVDEVLDVGDVPASASRGADAAAVEGGCQATQIADASGS